MSGWELVKMDEEALVGSAFGVTAEDYWNIKLIPKQFQNQSFGRCVDFQHFIVNSKSTNFEFNC